MASYATIVPGVGVTANSGTTDTAVLPITLNQGDCVVVFFNPGTNVGQTNPVTVTGPGTQTNWQDLGQINVAGSSYSRMFVLTNASAASGEIDVTRTGGQYIIAIAQPYTGVGQIVPSPLTQNMVNANPAILPSGVTSFDVTISGSMGVAGLGWLFGTANGLAFPSFRSQFIGSAQAVVLTDQTYPTIGPQVISFAWSSTSGTPTYTRIAVLLVPRLIPQPPVGSGDEDAPDNLSDPDDRLWADADEW